MPRIEDVLERESRTVDLEQGDFERLLLRRERKQRNRQLRAGAVGVIVALAMGIALVRSLTSDGIPADPPVDPTPAPGLALWPQTSMEEVRQAQELADARDPRYTWQLAVSEIQVAQNHPDDAEIFTRFLKEVLGWEEYLWDEAFAHRGFNAGEVIYVRCAPGLPNPLYPTDPERPACAPTLDELRYETVKISVAQPARQGSSGIWVVTGWEMIEPATQADPRVAEAEATAVLEAFLQARVEGEGAERLADFSDRFADVWVDQGVPLLYATSTGAPYERSELELVDGPLWPSGSMRFVVRLFAENGQTVVEQFFSLERGDTGRLRYDRGRLRLVYDSEGAAGPGPGTTENGKAIPLEYRFLDGTVTYRATHPLKPHDMGDRLAIAGLLPDDDAPRQVLVLLADPRPIGPDCEAGPAPADAEALARSIASDPYFDATAPVAVTIGGISALQIDVVRASGPNGCASLLLQHVPWVGHTRARLYLLDLPGGSARVLAIATITDDDSFETVLEFAAPVVDSIEFHAR